MRIHREGKFFIPLTFAFTLILAVVLYLLVKDTPVSFLKYPIAAAAGLLCAIVLNFFRNPEVKVNHDDNAVLSPCDGRVVVIEEVEEPIHFKGKRLQISIFMSPLNVHVNRNPIGGRVVFQKYFPGKKLMAFNPKSSTENEMNYVVISDGKREVGFKQIAGFLARRICWYVKEGDATQQGGEMGFIKFGSRIDVFLPVGTKVNVKLQEDVKGAVTKLATFAS